MTARTTFALGTARRMALALVIAVAFTLGFAPSASAASQQGAEDLAFGELSAFLAVYGQDPGYDWSSDGCTTPPISDLAYWNGVFRDACLRHDFGYSNFGKGEEFAVPTPAQRSRIDAQFRDDMYLLCAPRPFLRRAECRFVAYAYYSVVRRVGGLAYFA